MTTAPVTINNKRTLAPSTDVAIRKRQKVPGAPKNLWSSTEDEQLLSLVSARGESSWSEVAAQMPGRSGKQCRDRWRNHLNPKIKKGAWTDEEDRLLFLYQKKYGHSWSDIAKFIPGRTDLSVKNRYYSHKRKTKRQEERKTKRQEERMAKQLDDRLVRCSSVSSASTSTLPSFVDPLDPPSLDSLSSKGALRSNTSSPLPEHVAQGFRASLFSTAQAHPFAQQQQQQQTPPAPAGSNNSFRPQFFDSATIKDSDKVLLGGSNALNSQALLQALRTASAQQQQPQPARPAASGATSAELPPQALLGLISIQQRELDALNSKVRHFSDDNKRLAEANSRFFLLFQSLLSANSSAPASPSASPLQHDWSKAAADAEPARLDFSSLLCNTASPSSSLHVREPENEQAPTSPSMLQAEQDWPESLSRALRLQQQQRRSLSQLPRFRADSGAEPDAKGLDQAKLLLGLSQKAPADLPEVSKATSDLFSHIRAAWPRP